MKARYPNKRLLLRTSVFGWEKVDILGLPDYRSLNSATFIDYRQLPSIGSLY